MAEPSGQPTLVDIGDEPIPNTPDRRVTLRSARSLQGTLPGSDGAILGVNHGTHHHQQLSILECLKVILFASKFNILLVFIPLGIIADKLHWPPAAVFYLNFFAIIPLAKRKWTQHPGKLCFKGNACRYNRISYSHSAWLVPMLFYT